MTPRSFAAPSRWVFFGLAALSILMSSIDGTIVAVALPSLIADLDASLTWAGWTLTAYALAQTVMLPMAGKLAEQFGPMRVFLASVVLFTVGSLLCGLAPNVYALVACRVLQALGGGGFFPAATGIVAQQFPENRGRMIGLFATIFPMGAILGPNLGGFVIEQYGWRNIFYINVPLGLVIVALLARGAWAERPALATAPEGRKRRRTIDVLGTVLFTLAVVGVLGALTLLGDDPALVWSPLFWLLLLGSGVALVLFVRQERRAPDPVLDLELVVRQPFAVVNVFSVLTGVCFMGFFSFIPLYATLQYGMGPQESGAILTPRSLVMIAVSTTTRACCGSCADCWRKTWRPSTRRCAAQPTRWPRSWAPTRWTCSCTTRPATSSSPSAPATRRWASFSAHWGWTGCRSRTAVGRPKSSGAGRAG